MHQGCSRHCTNLGGGGRKAFSMPSCWQFCTVCLRIAKLLKTLGHLATLWDQKALLSLICRMEKMRHQEVHRFFKEHLHVMKPWVCCPKVALWSIAAQPDMKPCNAGSQNPVLTSSRQRNMIKQRPFSINDVLINEWKCNLSKWSKCKQICTVQFAHLTCAAGELKDHPGHGLIPKSTSSLIKSFSPSF